MAATTFPWRHVLNNRCSIQSFFLDQCTNRTCQHPPSWIFQMLRRVLLSEMSLLVAQTLHFKANKTLPFDIAV